MAGHSLMQDVQQESSHMLYHCIAILFIVLVKSDHHYCNFHNGSYSQQNIQLQDESMA